MDETFPVETSGKRRIEKKQPTACFPFDVPRQKKVSLAESKQGRILFLPSRIHSRRELFRFFKTLRFTRRRPSPCRFTPQARCPP
jgi:hypothetical protein